MLSEFSGDLCLLATTRGESVYVEAFNNLIWEMSVLLILLVATRSSSSSSAASNSLRISSYMGSFPSDASWRLLKMTMSSFFLLSSNDSAGSRLLLLN